MNNKYNQWFEKTANDPVLRREAIGTFTRRRALVFTCAVIVTLCAAPILFIKTNHPWTPVLLLISASISWLTVSRVDSQLRKLKLREQLSQDPGAKPAA
jgi:uncharacterized protein involved in exopolysaccharide biosynthesis